MKAHSSTPSFDLFDYLHIGMVTGKNESNSLVCLFLSLQRYNKYCTTKTPYTIKDIIINISQCRYYRILRQWLPYTFTSWPLNCPAKTACTANKNRSAKSCLPHWNTSQYTFSSWTTRYVVLDIKSFFFGHVRWPSVSWWQWPCRN